MRWINNKHQSIFFSKIESLPWREFNSKLMPPKVIKIDKPIRINTNDKGNLHYLIYDLNGEECIKELGQIVKIEENDIELEDEERFHLRVVQAAEDGSFTDMGNVYYPDGVVRTTQEAIYELGDFKKANPRFGDKKVVLDAI